MKTSVAALVALTAGSFVASLRRNGAAGYFEPLSFYKPAPHRRCACTVYVERIEDAVDAIVKAERPNGPRRTQRVALPVPAVLS